MVATNRRREPGSDEQLWLLGGAGVVALFGLFCAAWGVAMWAVPDTPADPFSLGPGCSPQMPGGRRVPPGSS